MSYAKDTRVPVDRSRAEVEKLVAKHGADQFINGWEQGRAMIGFRLNHRYIRMSLPLEAKGRGQNADQVVRSRWRLLVLVLKAKLEAIAGGVSTVEEEFLANIVMPDNQTVGRHLLPRIAEAYKTGKLPPLLPEASQ